MLYFAGIYKMKKEDSLRHPPYFGRQVATDFKKDPVKYVGVAAAVTRKICPHPVCKAIAGAVAAGVGAYEAKKHALDTPSN